MRGSSPSRQRAWPAATGWLALAALAVGCSEQPPPAPRPPLPLASPASATSATGPRAIADGREVLLRHQCQRCHRIDDLPAADRPLDCTSCHSFLDGLTPDDRRYQKIAASQGEAVLQRYQRNIEHLKLDSVPDLSRLADRVEPRWIDSFLQAPYDLRPTLSESMIRPNLSDEERRKIVRYFAAVAGLPDPYAGPVHDDTGSAPPQEQIDRGRALFATRGCAVCHTFGNVDFGLGADALLAGKAANQLAPNLRFTRERTRRDVLTRWLMAPQSVKPTTTMPAMGITASEAADLSAFLLHGDPLVKSAPALPALEPRLLERPVSYEEMKERTLGKVCVHCHMNDDEKDPGPGNLGGLGYAGIGLSMRTYETLVQGALDGEGRRYSVLQPREGERYPLIVESVLLRRHEHLRDRLPPLADTVRPPFPSERRGMPLGLPAFTDEEVSILYTWIEQGCPGPTAVSGKPGVDDGFLVPDGPIAKNQGCEQRDPSSVRPAWALRGGADARVP